MRGARVHRKNDTEQGKAVTNTTQLAHEMSAATGRPILEEYYMEETSLPHEEQGLSQNLKKDLDNIEKFQLLADIFKQLGDSTRLRLFWLLCHCEACVIELSAMMEMSSPAISHHLRLLRSSGLIVSLRKGKEVYYHAADTAQSQLLHRMIEQVSEIACPN